MAKAKKKTATRPQRERSKRRAAERSVEKLARARARLHALEPGGSPEHPIEVSAASQIDGVARSLTCPRCERGMFIHFEVGGVRDGRVTRRLDLVCRQCGAERTAHFAIGRGPPN